MKVTTNDKINWLNEVVPILGTGWVFQNSYDFCMASSGVRAGFWANENTSMARFKSYNIAVEWMKIVLGKVFRVEIVNIWLGDEKNLI